MGNSGDGGPDTNWNGKDSGNADSSEDGSPDKSDPSNWKGAGRASGAQKTDGGPNVDTGFVRERNG